MSKNAPESGFKVKFSNREVSAWGGMALLKRMLDQMGFREAASGWDLPLPGSNRGYPPVQLIEQWIVAIWCGACRFAHAETVRFDGTLTRLFGWPKAAGYQAIMRLFKRFDMARNEAVKASAYRWFFAQVGVLKRITLDMDSRVLTRHGEQEGATRGYNPGRRGRPSHHPLTSLNLPDVEVRRSYRGRADCKNRIKELKADFGLDSFALNNFWATEAALGFAMLAYNLISLFRQAVLRTKVQPTLATLHGQVLAIGASWHREADNNTLILSLPRKRRAWFKGLWTRSEDPPVIPVAT